LQSWNSSEGRKEQGSEVERFAATAVAENLENRREGHAKTTVLDEKGLDSDGGSR